MDEVQQIKNRMDLSDPNITRIGQYDADELNFIKENKEALKMIEEGRIGLDGEFDCGGVWVKLGDKEAFAIASEIVQ